MALNALAWIVTQSRRITQMTANTLVWSHLHYCNTLFRGPSKLSFVRFNVFNTTLTFWNIPVEVYDDKDEKNKFSNGKYFGL